MYSWATEQVQAAACIGHVNKRPRHSMVNPDQGGYRLGGTKYLRLGLSFLGGCAVGGAGDFLGSRLGAAIGAVVGAVRGAKSGAVTKSGVGVAMSCGCLACGGTPIRGVSRM